MALKLPPFPANSPPGSWVWVDWWKKLQDYINQITAVAQQGNVPTAPIDNITGTSGTASVNWVVIGNYCQFDIDIPVLTGVDIVASSSYIRLVGTPPNIGLPPIVGQALCYLAAFSEDGAPAVPPDPNIPFVQSLGVGYIRNVSGELRCFLPDFTVTGGGVGSQRFNNIHITGRYNVS